MAKTVGFGKLEREMLSNERLPKDVQVAVIEFKNRIRSGDRSLEIFTNKKDQKGRYEQVLPAAAGCHWHLASAELTYERSENFEWQFIQ